MTIIGLVLHLFFDIDWLAALLMSLGAFGFVLVYGFNITKKHIKSKCSIGRKIRICYIIGFSVATTGIVFMLITRNFSWDSWGALAFFGFWMTGIYLSSVEKSEDFLLEEQERKRKFEADDDE